MKIPPFQLIPTACALVAATLLTVGSSARAATGYTPSGILTNSNGAYGGAGFDFTLTSTITVTQLAFYAISISGGDHPHAYLFDVTTGTMLADTGDLNGQLPNSNGYNFITLATPVTLAIGDVYQVSAPAYFVPTYPTAATFTYGSGIVPAGFYQQGSFTGFTQTAPYTTAVAANVPTVANFTYTVAGVPEPSSVALLALGSTFALGVTLRRRRQTND